MSEDTNNPYQATAVEHKPKRKNHWLVITLVFFVTLVSFFGLMMFHWETQRARMAQQMEQEALRQAVRAQDQMSRTEPQP